MVESLNILLVLLDLKMLNIPFICVRCSPTFTSTNKVEIDKHVIKHMMKDDLEMENKIKLMKNAKSFSGGEFINCVFTTNNLKGAK